jgi:hypothetical protein
VRSTIAVRVVVIVPDAAHVTSTTVGRTGEGDGPSAVAPAGENPLSGLTPQRRTRFHAPPTDRPNVRQSPSEHSSSQEAQTANEATSQMPPSGKLALMTKARTQQALRRATRGS